jgi:hypothetical protein
MKSFSKISLILVLILSLGVVRLAQAQSPALTYQTHLNTASGCYERLFVGNEAERAVPASEIVSALNDGACVIVTHGIINEVIDLTSIAPTLPIQQRKIVSLVRITDSEVAGIKAGALGDTVKTHFAESVDFSGSQIKGDAEFVNANFSANVNFAHTLFSGTAAFNGASFTDKASFAGANFKQLAFFFGATFNDEANFSEAHFETTVRLFNVVFKKSVNFSDATFGSTIDMSNSLYEGKTNFANAHFVRGALAKNIEFNGPVRFDGVRVDDSLDFSTTQFNQSAIFNRGVLSGTRFFNVRFRQGADFTSARFTTDTSFNSAFFGAIAFFANVTFEQAALLSNTIFLGDAIFTNVKFLGDADFNSARFSGNLGPDFAAAQFEKTLNLENIVSAGALRLTWEQVQKKLNPETKQVLSVLEKNFQELRQGEDAVAACNAQAQLEKDEAQQVGVARCALLGATLGIVPRLAELANPKKHESEKVEKPTPAKTQPKEKSKTVVAGLVPIIVLVVGLALFLLVGVGK